MNKVIVVNCNSYQEDDILSAYTRLIKLLNVNFNDIINQNDTIVIKPNWIKEHHETKKEEWKYLITHPIVTYSTLQLILTKKKINKIKICDSPQTESSFKQILKLNKCNELFELAQKFNTKLEILDLREDEWIDKKGVIIERKKLTGDPLGSLTINLGKYSYFIDKPISKNEYYGADYDKNETFNAHVNGKHLYKISKSVLESDLIFNLPKLKTHKKTGITVALKNMVGINTYKNYLPHYTIGYPDKGGDQFPCHTIKNKVEQRTMNFLKNLWLNFPPISKYFSSLVKIGRKSFGDNEHTIRSGNWYGNDTVWRMILDLNKILFYCDKDGNLTNKIQRKYFCIVDGILAGEGNGPLAPDPKKSNLIIAGFNPVAIDCVCAKLMGFNYLKIPMLFHAFDKVKHPLVNFDYKDIEIISDRAEFNGKLININPKHTLYFKPPLGWIGHIEL